MSSTSTADRDVLRVDRMPRGILLLGLAALLLEGYDVIMYGTIVPSLLTDSDWHVTPADAGHFASLAVLGMLVGALLAGLFTDWFGRRRVLITSVALFSVGMALCAVASSPGQFGVLRFVVGIGTGCLLPTVVAMVVEYSPARSRGLNVAIAFTGTGFGGAAAGILASLLLPGHDFRIMFWIGALPAALVLPLMWRLLPESAAYLLATGRTDAARAVAQRYGVEIVPASGPSSGVAGSRWTAAARGLAAPRHLLAAGVFCVAVFFCLFVLFGVNAWLPAVMIKAGYGVTSSLTFLLVLNLGAVVGTLVASPIADRIGFKPVVVVCFLGAGVALALLATKPPVAVVYLLVAVAGIGTNGTQILINSYVGSWFPTTLRAAALGLALGVGRIGGVLGPTYGGAIADLTPARQLVAYAVPAVIGAVVILAVPRRRPAPAAAGTQTAAWAETRVTPA